MFPAFASPPDITTVFHRNLSETIQTPLFDPDIWRCLDLSDTCLLLSIPHRSSLPSCFYASNLLCQFSLSSLNTAQVISPSPLFDHPHISVVLSVPLLSPVHVLTQLPPNTLDNIDVITHPRYCKHYPPSITHHLLFLHIFFTY